MDNWVEYVVAILSGLAVCIPLVVKLVKYVQVAIQTKNWGKLLELVANRMVDAEKLFKTGEERKEYVMTGINDLAASVGYPLDEEDLHTISEMIDTMCKMAKTVNSGKVTSK